MTKNNNMVSQNLLSKDLKARRSRRIFESVRYANNFSLKCKVQHKPSAVLVLRGSIRLVLWKHRLPFAHRCAITHALARNRWKCVSSYFHGIDPSIACRATHSTCLLLITISSLFHAITDLSIRASIYIS